MPESIAQYLKEDMSCESLLDCIHGSKELDKKIYFRLVDVEKALSVDEIAEQVDRERSTAYRSVQRLLENKFLEQKQVNQENGGYHHVYKAKDPEEVADRTQRKLNDWYAQMGGLIHEFRQKYSRDE
ncbi:helix-turn-helix domain-containing protein [Candidatus Nanohalococcus occultus]